jgi:hypothetical protein
MNMEKISVNVSEEKGGKDAVLTPRVESAKAEEKR